MSFSLLVAFQFPFVMTSATLRLPPLIVVKDPRRTITSAAAVRPFRLKNRVTLN